MKAAARFAAPMALLLLLLFVPPLQARGAPAERTRGLSDGDLVFHESRSAQSEAIRLATGSRYTHVGVVFHRGGRPVVVEGAATVRATPYDRWVARGRGGHVLVKRLRDRGAVDAELIARMSRVADGFLGRPYDARFEWGDERLYCSELVYKIYERGAGIRIGRLAPAGSFDFTSPAVRELLARRFPGPPSFDPDEPVLSPASMAEDPASSRSPRSEGWPLCPEGRSFRPMDRFRRFSHDRLAVDGESLSRRAPRSPDERS